MPTFTQVVSSLSARRFRLKYRRMLLPAMLIVLILQPSTHELIMAVLADAFLQVSAFVAATLALYYGVTHSLGQQRINDVVGGHPTYGVLLAAMLGALPGCGGAIVVITQFTKGNISFGAVVAVLTATMGDAAFLLLAQQPLDGLSVMLVSLLVASMMGYLINRLHNPGFMRPSQSADSNTNRTCTQIHPQRTVSRISLQFWQWLLIPSLCLGLLAAFQLNTDQLLGLAEGSIELTGAVACIIAVMLWSLSSTGDSYSKVTSEENTNPKKSWMLKVAMDTQFVTSWVVAAFMVFELAVFWFDLDLAAAFHAWGAWVIVLAVLIGFLPGCGPQIMVTGLYLQSVIPFSAQLGNAISNDGDALFPAIALAPKAAILATLYSALPALLVGYGYFYLFETTT